MNNSMDRLLEDLRIAYGFNDYETIDRAGQTIICAIKEESEHTYLIKEPQLSALLLMAQNYAKIKARAQIEETHSHPETQN